MIDIPQGMIDAFSHEEQWTAVLCKDMNNVLQNGTPIQTVTNAEEAEAYPIAECKECRTCKHCMRNKKLPKITWEKGYPLIFCARHHDHFASSDTCEFWMKR
jgi:hypothetical protein